MQIAVRKEMHPGERRVSLVPASVAQLVKAGMQVMVQTSAGLAAGFSDEDYTQKGATIFRTPDEMHSADIITAIRAAGAERDTGDGLLQTLRPGQAVIATCDPLGSASTLLKWADRGITLFSLELIPRITRAQSMDVLSSQGTIAGYRAVLLAATELPKMFPMLMTAAGTITAAKVLVLGVGVAGLQAIAIARKLGAVVSAFDVRPPTREQVESLGARFVDLGLDSSSAEDRWWLCQGTRGSGRSASARVAGQGRGYARCRYLHCGHTRQTISAASDSRSSRQHARRKRHRGPRSRTRRQL